MTVKMIQAIEQIRQPTRTCRAAHLLVAAIWYFLICSPTASAADEKRLLCEDPTYLRRASVVLTGRVPTDELRELLNAQPSLDRADLVDRLLDSDEYAAAWSRWMSAMLGCEEMPLSTAAFAMKVPRERVFWLWQEWTREKLRNDTPYGDIVAELVASDSRLPTENREAYFASHRNFVDELKTDFRGTGFLARGQNDLFWKTNRTAEQNAELIARNLLGYRLECAKCHDHPYAEWTMDDHGSFCAVLQRTVYAELPLTHSEKTGLLRQAGLGGAGLLLILCGSFCALYHFQRRVWAAVPFLLAAVCCGLVFYAGLHFRHLLLGGVSGVTEAPASALAKLSPYSRIASVPVFCGCLLSIGWLTRRLCRTELSHVLLGLNFVSVATLTVAGILSIETFWLSTDPSQQTFTALAKSRLLNDTRAQQSDEFVREVYDDTNGNYLRLGSPKLLDGPIIPETATARPRQQLADWLLTEQGDQLDRSFINRVAQRVFGTAFVLPVDDVLPDSEITDEAFFQELTDGFRQHDRSIKWLLKTMVMSERFQIAAASNTRRVEFLPRTLRAEEIVASLNQLPGGDIRLNARWTPTPGDPYSCGSEAPRNSDLADRIINTGMRSEESADLPAALVAILMVDEAFAQAVQNIIDQISKEADSSQDVIEQLSHSLWTKRLTPDMLSQLNDPDVDLKTAAWAIINNHRFLVVD